MAPNDSHGRKFVAFLSKNAFYPENRAQKKCNTCFVTQKDLV